MIYEPKESLIQLPSLWLPDSRRRPSSYPSSSRGMPGYPCCDPCTACDGSRPSEVFITFDDFVSVMCSDCESLNDTFTLPFDRFIEFPSFPTCRAVYADSFTFGDCQFDIEGTISFEGSIPRWRLDVTIDDGWEGGWLKVGPGASLIPCSGINETLNRSIFTTASCVQGSPFTCVFTTA